MKPHEFVAMSGVELTLEGTRKIIVYLAMGCFAGIITIIVVIGWMILRLPVDDTQKILTTTSAVLSGIVGAIVGFYFRCKE